METNATTTRPLPALLKIIAATHFRQDFTTQLRKEISMKYLALAVFIFGCNHSKNTVGKNTEANPPLPQETVIANRLQQQGIDFTAVGSIPQNWHLEMNYDDTVHFTADDGLSLAFAFHSFKKNMTAERSIYSTTLKGSEVTLVIEEKDCTVPTMRESFRKAVTFTFNSKAYTGCGKFLADNTIYNKWLLEKIGAVAIAPDEYNRIPIFQFDRAQQRVSGNDGCNSIGGKAEVQGNRILFGDLVSTRMACMKKSIDGIIGAKVSGKLVSYYFRDGKLFLYLEDDSLLVFNKGQ